MNSWEAKLERLIKYLEKQPSSSNDSCARARGISEVSRMTDGIKATRPLANDALIDRAAENAIFPWSAADKEAGHLAAIAGGADPARIMRKGNKLGIETTVKQIATGRVTTMIDTATRQSVAKDPVNIKLTQ